MDPPKEPVSATKHEPLHVCMMLGTHGTKDITVFEKPQDIK
jgi:hypothetical protein